MAVVACRRESVLSEELSELLFSDSDSEMAATAVERGQSSIPDRIYVHQLNLTSADLRRRQLEKQMVEEEARKVRELKEIKWRQRQEEMKRDMEMLRSYNPWGKPGAGAKSEEGTKRKRYPEGRTPPEDAEDEQDYLPVEGFIRQFGRPGHGAPNRTNSGRIISQIAGDPAIRFQDTQDVRLSIENQLRYKHGTNIDKNSYKGNLDELVEQKQKQQQKEREWENKKLEEMLEQYPFGKEEPNNGGSYLSHADPMFMATRPKRTIIKDEDFDPWGKGFGNPAWDKRGNVQRHKFIPSVDEGIPDPPSNTLGRTTNDLGLRRWGGGAGAPHYTQSGHHKTRLRNTLRNVKSMGPHIDDSYNPWGRPGGGAPFERQDGGKPLEEKLGWSMTGHPKRRTRDAKDEYRKELQQEIQEQLQKKQKEHQEIHEPVVRIRPPQRVSRRESAEDVASIIRKGAGGRPRKDPVTGELLPNPRLLTDVTQERLDIRRTRSQESLAYHSELAEQAAQRQEMREHQKMAERAQSEKHLLTLDSFWGRPGHGAPRDPVNHKKENIDKLLDTARPVEPYVKRYVTEVVPSQHKNRYDVPSKDVLAIKRDYEFRTPFPATEV